MADRKHLEILKQGGEAWNSWRNSQLRLRPDLSGAKLNRFDLRFMYLSNTDLGGTELIAARLSKANLIRARLRGAELCLADLTEANLTQADLSGADLSEADLSNSYLINTNLSGANLAGTDFSSSVMGATVLNNNDLSSAKGLESVEHFYPSDISVETLLRSDGQIPEVFLRGVGLSDDFITYIPSLVVGMQSIQFYSCFISYSSIDEIFAQRIYADLQNNGVRCWFAPKDLRIGDKIRPKIDESIRLHDKLLLILSKTSIRSQWVEQEVETALAREREQNRIVLFPIRIDDYVMKINSGWPALIKNSRNIGNFKKWREHDSYQKAFNRLLSDLRVSDSQ